MNLNNVRGLVKALLIELGEDPDRPGLLDTPDRVARFWEEFIAYDPGRLGTVFEANDITNGTDQMVVVGPMRVWSLCEHHLLPFYTDVIVGYIPEGKILGLSKFARIANYCAHRLQVQERLIEDVAKEVTGFTGTDNVAVIGYGEHLCMTMRGIKTPSKMVSSVLHGDFRKDAAVRTEFLSLSRTLHLGDQK